MPAIQTHLKQLKRHSGPPGSSSSTRTVVDQAFAFASRRGKNGEDRPRFFCETNPILGREAESHTAGKRLAPLGHAIWSTGPGAICRKRWAPYTTWSTASFTGGGPVSVSVVRLRKLR